MEAPVHEYPLARGYRAAARLNLQHYIWKQSAGYLIHPDITLEANAKVADIGTGTGIWLLDPSGSLPLSVELHGYDIDLSQCPPKEWLPSNVNMRKLDVYKDIPEEFLGQFHSQYFICVVKHSDPKPLLRSLLRMLKPNGWIQWSEIDIQTLHVRTAFPYAETDYTSRLMKLAISPTSDWSPENQHWVATLADCFKCEGLINVVEDRQTRLPWTLPSLQDATILLVEEFGSRVPYEPEYQQIIQLAAHELDTDRRGVAIESEIVTVIGRKGV